jgi:hypothetical protein
VAPLATRRRPCQHPRIALPKEISMRALTAAALLAGLFLAAPASADDRDYLPRRHAVMVEGMDFPGGDLAPLFDVSFETCEATCLADMSCQAFTYNRRSSACFPKSAVTAQQPYQGAISGRVLATDPAALASAPLRAAELDFLRPEDFDAALAQARGLGAEHIAGERGRPRLCRRGRARRRRPAGGDAADRGCGHASRRRRALGGLRLGPSQHSDR